MIFVAFGGFLGAIARFSISEWLKKQLNRPGFVATFFINCIGSFFLGLCMGLGMNREVQNLKNKRATIVNLQRIDREQAIRIIDFLSGTVYALGGEIQRVGTNIFLCTPDNVEVSGEISEYLYEDI